MFRARFPRRDSTPSAHLLNITPQRGDFPIVLLVCSHSIPSIPVAAGNQRHSDTTSWAQVSLHPPPKVSNTPDTRGMLCFVHVIQFVLLRPELVDHCDRHQRTLGARHHAARTPLFTVACSGKQELYMQIALPADCIVHI